MAKANRRIKDLEGTMKLNDQLFAEKAQMQREAQFAANTIIELDKKC